MRLGRSVKWTEKDRERLDRLWDEYDRMVKQGNVDRLRARDAVEYEIVTARVDEAEGRDQ